MTIGEEPNPTPTTDHLLDWLEDTISFLPSFLDDPYNDEEINGYQWWNQDQYQNPTNTSTLITTTTPTTVTSSPPAPTKKRKKTIHDQISKPPHHQRRTDMSSERQPNTDNEEEEEESRLKKSITTKKSTTKTNNSNTNISGGHNKDARWAEQLLNPCALAIDAGHLTRVQHLLYVLNELASASGDPNQRLAWHGLRALTHHLSPASAASTPHTTFATTEPRLFQNSLLRFNEISPWFAFPNSLANASILQTSTGESKTLHIVDIGVSHGLQWPTLLEALTRRSGGPPEQVRLTVVVPAGGTAASSPAAPFSVGPDGHDFPSHLLRFAKRNDLNLQIQTLTFQTLTLQTLLPVSPNETLIVCAQFRLHNLRHENPDERTAFLNLVRELEPELVILSEYDSECGCSSCCGDFATRFSQRMELLWRFLDSTSAAFKGRELEERRVLEGEASRGLASGVVMGEGKERWCERMRALGFSCEGFGEDAIEGGRALLRKYDCNWEMRGGGEERVISLCWKGQPVSFCSLWKLAEPQEEKKTVTNGFDSFSRSGG